MTNPLTTIRQQRGGTKEMARVCGITSQAVSRWQQIPEKHLVAVEQAFRISREQLRPDLYTPRQSAGQMQKGAV